MKLDSLASQIESIDLALGQAATKAINAALTARNWLIGYYIVEYEHRGQDRAEYGKAYTEELARRLDRRGLSARNLWLFRQFFLTYPQIGTALTQSTSTLPQILQSSIAEYSTTSKPASHGNLQSPTAEFETSDSPAALSSITQNATLPEPSHAALTKDVYTFEFLGIPIHHAVEESELESALLAHLQDFLLELGHGFCLESRQKRILIGDEYYFIDLVFYHRLLRCHVLVELKIGAFDHESAGQLNTYLNYYRAEIAAPDDNPPVGILLVTDKNQALVEYATAGMDEKLFVKKYLLQLPSPERLQRFIEEELHNL